MLKACYSGYQRGLLAELFSLLGLLSATALACNFQPIISQWVLPWWRFDPGAAQFTVFAALLITGVVLFRIVARVLARLVSWELSSWIVSLMSAALGAVRGLWIAGLLALIGLSGGWAYAQQSIAQRSLAAPALVETMRNSLDTARAWYPGDRMSQPAVPVIVRDGAHS